MNGLGLLTEGAGERQGGHDGRAHRAHQGQVEQEGGGAGPPPAAAVDDAKELQG